MTRSLSNMSLESMAEQLLCLMGTVTTQAPRTVLILGDQVAQLV